MTRETLEQIKSNPDLLNEIIAIAKFTHNSKPESIGRDAMFYIEEKANTLFKVGEPIKSIMQLE